MTQETQDWIYKASACIRKSDILHLDINDVNNWDVEGLKSLRVETKFFNSDALLRELPAEVRKNIEFKLISTDSKSGNYVFHIRPDFYGPFNSTFGGHSVIQKIIEEDEQESLENVIDYRTSKKGIVLITENPDQPYVFPRISTKDIKLYKTYMDGGNYVFVFRQKGDQKPQEYKERLSQKRVDRVCWDTELNCVNCSSWNTVQYKPDPNGNAGFVFNCDHCEKTWEPTQPLVTKLSGEMNRGLIQSKLKQSYMTAVGTPD